MMLGTAYCHFYLLQLEEVYYKESAAIHNHVSYGVSNYFTRNVTQALYANEVNDDSNRRTFRS